MDAKILMVKIIFTEYVVRKQKDDNASCLPGIDKVNIETVSGYILKLKIYDLGKAITHSLFWSEDLK